MNSTLKTTWIVIGAVVIIWAIFALVTRNNSNVSMSGDNSASTSVQADRSTGSPASSNGNTSSNSASSQDNSNSGLISDSALAMMVGNSLVRVPQTGVDVALTAGNADYTSGTSKGHITIGRILGRVTTDQGTDVVAEMNLTKSGSPSVLNYIAMFHNVGQTVTYTSSILIGDRITISSIAVSPDKTVTTTQPQNYVTSSIGYNVTVNYLDRKNGEPFTTSPSLPETKTVHVKNHILAS